MTTMYVVFKTETLSTIEWVFFTRKTFCQRHVRCMPIKFYTQVWAHKFESWK